MASKKLNRTGITPFSVEDRQTAVLRWEEWVEQFWPLLYNKNIVDKKQQKDFLLLSAGTEIQEILEKFTQTSKEQENDVEAAIKSISNYFATQYNRDYAIHKFRQCKQYTNESITQYVVRLECLARHCKFTNHNDEIKAQILDHGWSDKVREKAFQEQMTLDQLIEFAKTVPFEPTKKEVPGHQYLKEQQPYGQARGQTHPQQTYKGAENVGDEMYHFNSRLARPLKTSQRIQQKYDYFLVLDFEATCDKPKTPDPQEIIEFPVLKVNAKTYEVESKFHQFVKPVYHPNLTFFCMQLTSITQDEVDAGCTFRYVLKDFENWIREDVGISSRFLFVTCGDWDLKVMLPNQCNTSDVAVPLYCNEWLNIKKVYTTLTGVFSKGMMPMIEGLNLEHTGTHHRGLDDCVNIANILRALADRGCKFEPSNRNKQMWNRK